MFGLPGSDDEDKIFLVDFGLSSRSVTAVFASLSSKQNSTRETRVLLYYDIGEGGGVLLCAKVKGTGGRGT